MLHSTELILAGGHPPPLRHFLCQGSSVCPRAGVCHNQQRGYLDTTAFTRRKFPIRCNNELALNFVYSLQVICNHNVGCRKTGYCHLIVGCTSHSVLSGLAVTRYWSRHSWRRFSWMEDKYVQKHFTRRS